MRFFESPITQLENALSPTPSSLTLRPTAAVTRHSITVSSSAHCPLGKPTPCCSVGLSLHFCLALCSLWKSPSPCGSQLLCGGRCGPPRSPHRQSGHQRIFPVGGGGTWKGRTLFISVPAS